MVQSFLGCDAPKAAHIVADLMTARMKQFELVAETELPIVAADFGLDQSGRDKLKQYVVGFQHWLSGILVWHQSVARYKEPELKFDRAQNLLPARPQGMTGSPGGSLARHLADGPSGFGTSAARIASLFGAKS